MIRKAEKKDKDLYLKMAHDFYHSPAVLHPIPDVHMERTFEEYMGSNACSGIYILEYAGSPAGYALTAKTFSQEAGGYVYWLEELYILEEYRSKGLGSEFFSYMEEHKDKGTGRFRLEVEENNTRAMALYEKLGYKRFEYVQMVKEFKHNGSAPAKQQEMAVKQHSLKEEEQDYD